MESLSLEELNKLFLAIWQIYLKIIEFKMAAVSLKRSFHPHVILPSNITWLPSRDRAKPLLVF
jgi:hypothetical protein